MPSLPGQSLGLGRNGTLGHSGRRALFGRPLDHPPANADARDDVYALGASMTRYTLLVLVCMLAQATVFADGGLVQLRKEAGAFVITVFTSPAPLSAGPVDISLLLQNRNGLEPVLDASVSLLLRADASSTELRARATREQAQNKLL